MLQERLAKGITSLAVMSKQSLLSQHELQLAN